MLAKEIILSIYLSYLVNKKRKNYKYLSLKMTDYDTFDEYMTDLIRITNILASITFFY